MPVAVCEPCARYFLLERPLEAPQPCPRCGSPLGESSLAALRTDLLRRRLEKPAFRLK